MAVRNPVRETTINLRASAAQKNLIDQAAKLSAQSRSSFMIAASVQRAESVLADRVRFVLSEAQMAAFQAALDAPLANPEGLRDLLTHRAPWQT